MKAQTLALLVCSILVCLCANFAGAQTKTIVLVRHAEKDTTIADDPDPDLSQAGRERAVRLEAAVRRFRPYVFYATATARARRTIEPIAARRNKGIQTYDPTQHPELVEKIIASKRRHFLISGHSNTIPFLANLLANKEIFRQLPDAEYGVIYVVKLKKGVFQKLEILAY